MMERKKVFGEILGILVFANLRGVSVSCFIDWQTARE